MCYKVTLSALTKMFPKANADNKRYLICCQKTVPLYEKTAETRIPITVLTGFLGSGKMTVLSHLGQIGALDRTLILVNEFGEVGLDHELLTPIDDDTMVAVNSGCICCTIRADLVQTLSEAPWRFARHGRRWFDRVIIETTGIADPAPILQTIIGGSKRYRKNTCYLRY